MLEITLESPNANFLYITAQPLMYALHRNTVERVGKNWWKPKTIVSNGPFTLDSIDSNGYTLRRNLEYFDTTQGNLSTVEYATVHQTEPKKIIAEILDNYLNETYSLTSYIDRNSIPPDLKAEHAHTLRSELWTEYLAINLDKPPFDDIRVRLALAKSIDRIKVVEAISAEMQIAQGGLIPWGLSGHTPDLCISHDPEGAKALLAEAGYPNGKNFPTIRFAGLGSLRKEKELARQISAVLGVDVELVDFERWDYFDWHSYTVLSTGYIADYPDPESFMSQSSITSHLIMDGWNNPKYLELIEKAKISHNRKRRMEHYRKLDRLLVVDEVLFIPLFYGGEQVFLIQPWIKNYHRNLIGSLFYEDVIIEGKRTDDM
jgi:oligopeptide transport system substrate-binding protein